MPRFTKRFRRRGYRLGIADIQALARVVEEAVGPSPKTHWRGPLCKVTGSEWDLSCDTSTDLVEENFPRTVRAVALHGRSEQATVSVDVTVPEAMGLEGTVKYELESGDRAWVSVTSERLEAVLSHCLVPWHWLHLGPAWWGFVALVFVLWVSLLNRLLDKMHYTGEAKSVLSWLALYTCILLTIGTVKGTAAVYPSVEFAIGPASAKTGLRAAIALLLLGLVTNGLSSLVASLLRW